MSLALTKRALAEDLPHGIAPAPNCVQRHCLVQLEGGHFSLLGVFSAVTPVRGMVSWHGPALSTDYEVLCIKRGQTRELLFIAMEPRCDCTVSSQSGLRVPYQDSRCVR